MDPITAAIVAAIAAGATEVGKTAVVDVYNGVKALIKRKFGQTELPEAIEKLEKRPESKGRQETVKEEIEMAKADKDPEIIKEIEKLQEVIQRVQKREAKGDDIKIEAGGDVVFAKDSGKAIQVKNSQVGVIGENAKISGGIHYKNQK